MFLGITTLLYTYVYEYDGFLLMMCAIKTPPSACACRLRLGSLSFWYIIDMLEVGIGVQYGL